MRDTTTAPLERRHTVTVSRRPVCGMGAATRAQRYGALLAADADRRVQAAAEQETASAWYSAYVRTGVQA